MILKNKFSVITGCNRGIGLEILKTFSENGANIFACVRNIDDKFNDVKNSLEEKYKNKIIPIKFDLSDKNSVKDATKEILKYDKLDCIVNNAAIIHNKLFQITKIEEFHEVFEVNFFNQVLFTQGLLRKIIKNKSGSIIFLSSSAAADGNIGRSVYSSSKAAIESFAKVLSRELGTYKIRVNSVSPGLTETDMMRKSTDVKFLEEIVNDIPLKKIGTPVDISKIILFLASDYSEYLTGQNIRIDGGLKW